MENQELKDLNLKNTEEIVGKSNDLGVLNLKEPEKSEGYENLSGTGVKPLRVISTLLIVLGVILCIAGIAQIADSSSYHPEREYIGTICISAAITCFVTSPIYLVMATIGEAAKIYKDKNTK